MRVRTRKFVPTLVAIALAAGALSACGGDDDGDTGTATTPVETTTQPTQTDAGGGGQQTAAQGAQIFNDSGCASCHTLAAADASGVVGPNLDETAAGESPEQIMTSIVDPDADITSGFGPGIMPSDYAEQLSPAQIDALSAFIAQNAGNG